MWPKIPVLGVERHYGDRRVRCYVDRPGTVDEMLVRAAAERPGSLAYVDGECRRTYAQLDSAANALAGGLASRGVQPGDRVALLLDNRGHFAEAFFGILRAGAIAVPLNVRQQKGELEYLIGHAEAKVIIHESRLSERLPAAKAVPSVRHRICVGEAVPGSDPLDTLKSSTRPQITSPGEESTVAILYTSGTTGKPKGAMLTNLSIITSTMNYEHCWGLGRNDRAFMAVPASHVTGLVAIMLTMVRVRGTTVFVGEFKAVRFLELAAAERMTYTILVPAMYSLCLMQSGFEQFDLREWRIGGYGGAPMPSAIIAGLAARMPWLQLVNAYGATETTSPTTLMPPGEGVRHAETVGRPVPTADVVVRDSDGRALSPGQSGDIWIGGSHLAAGYWRDEAATRAAFKEGFWSSGDVGALTDDGYLLVLDRKKDLINRGGYKVYSAEIEATLMKHPGVAEVALIPVADPVLGEKSHAVVYCKDRSLTEDEIKQFCAERLSDYKVPDFVSFVEQPLPRNAAGKLLKRELTRSMRPSTAESRKQ